MKTLSENPADINILHPMINQNMSTLSKSYAKEMPDWVLAKYFDQTSERLLERLFTAAILLSLQNCFAFCFPSKIVLQLARLLSLKRIMVADSCRSMETCRS